MADFVPGANPAAIEADTAEQVRGRQEGERVVTGQRLMQASSDIFLGWLRATPTGQGEQDYYLRQLRDWKVSAEIEQLTPSSMATFARLCGWTLARAHARAGDRIAIAAYLGKSDRFDQAVADFAGTYADQNETDHATLAAAVDAESQSAVRFVMASVDAADERSRSAFVTGTSTTSCAVEHSAQPCGSPIVPRCTSP